MAATATLSSRSVFTSLRSECSVASIVTASIPISVHFSTIHSIRSICFVGAMARWSRKGRAP